MESSLECETTPIFRRPIPFPPSVSVFRFLLFHAPSLELVLFLTEKCGNAIFKFVVLLYDIIEEPKWQQLVVQKDTLGITARSWVSLSTGFIPQAK